MTDEQDNSGLDKFLHQQVQSWMDLTRQRERERQNRIHERTSYMDPYSLEQRCQNMREEMFKLRREKDNLQRELTKSDKIIKRMKDALVSGAKEAGRIADEMQGLL